MENSKISVIIPVYNTSEYLPRCLDSILQNTYQNFEVICINDGSTDNSAAVLEQYAASDPRIIVINKINEGVSAARNTGLDVAKGDFIAFIDSDDWIHPQYFETLIYFQAKANADIVAGSYMSVTETVPSKLIDIPTCKTSSLDFEEIMGCGYLKRMIWGRMYRRECIADHRFPVGVKWGEDTIFNVSILCDVSNLRTTLIDEILYFYFQRATSAVYSLKTIEKIPVCQFYLNEAIRTENNTRKKVFLLECAKQLLAHRYAAKVCAEHEAYRQCQDLIWKSFIYLKNTSIKLTQKMIIAFLFICPCAYRLYRIIDDPTLLEWERNEKRKQKEQSARKP